MRFLIDAQLPPVLSRLLIQAGHVSEHVAEVGLVDADDQLIWDYAGSCGAIIVTKDEDFASRKILQPDSPQVVWLRIGNCTNQALVKWFIPILPAVIERLQSGDALVELI